MDVKTNYAHDALSRKVLETFVDNTRATGIAGTTLQTWEYTDQIGIAAYNKYDQRLGDARTATGKVMSQEMNWANEKVNADGWCWCWCDGPDYGFAGKMVGPPWRPGPARRYKMEAAQARKAFWKDPSRQPFSREGYWWPTTDWHGAGAYMLFGTANFGRWKVPPPHTQNILSGYPE